MKCMESLGLVGKPKSKQHALLSKSGRSSSNNKNAFMNIETEPTTKVPVAEAKCSIRTAFVPVLLLLSSLNLMVRGGYLSIDFNARSTQGASSNHTAVSFNEELDALNADVVDAVDTPQTCRRPALNRTLQHGSWIGNTWVPPRHWRHYSAEELRQLYSSKKILWMGDSTSRRSSMTFYASLVAGTAHPGVDQINHPSVIDKGKTIRNVNYTGPVYEDTDGAELCASMNATDKQYPAMCRKLPGDGGQLVILQAVLCFSKVNWYFHLEEEGLKSPSAESADVIVISTGIWEVRFPGTCQKASKGDKPVLQRLEEAVDMVEQYQQKSGKTIIWRTTGFMAAPDADAKSSQLSKSINQKLMDRIDYHRAKDDPECDDDKPRLTYVDWGGAIEPRVYGTDRINGDMAAHHGLEPRIVLMQMITNQLVQEGALQEPVDRMSMQQ